MTTLFSDELLARLSKREEEIARGHGITIDRLENLSSELKRARAQSIHKMALPGDTALSSDTEDVA